MKALLTLLIATLCLHANILSIEDIKKEYAAIQSHEKSYTKTTKELMGISAEGTQATIYKDQYQELKILQLAIYGEMGNSIETYYFYHNQLFFLYKAIYRYNAPIYAPQHNETKTKVSKERYYWIDSKMVRWIEESHTINPKSDLFKQKELEIYRSLSRILAGLL